MRTIDQAFRDIPRENFLTDEEREFSQLDTPLPIGAGQTNSQPTTVRMMLEWLDVKKSQKILDVGSGSGWTTALLAYLTGDDGFVYGVEKEPELVDFGRRNIARIGIGNAAIEYAGDYLGLPSAAPFDRILVSASAQEMPEELLGQLSVGGKMVLPVGTTIFEVTKNDTHLIDKKSHTGFVFVPLR